MIVVCACCEGVFEFPDYPLEEGATLVEGHYYCDGCEGKVFLKVPIAVEVNEN